MEYLFYLAFFGFLIYTLWSIYTRKGRAHVFGGDFLWSSESYGEPGHHELIVHKLEPTKNTNDETVGIEIRSDSDGEFTMSTFRLTPERARMLARDIEKAASYNLPLG